MDEFEVIPSAMRYILFDPVRFILLQSNEAVYHCVSQGKYTVAKCQGCYPPIIAIYILN